MSIKQILNINFKIKVISPIVKKIEDQLVMNYYINEHLKYKFSVNNTN